MSKTIRIAHIMGKMGSGGVESVVMNYYRHINRAKVQFDFIIDEDSTIVPYAEIERLGGRIYKIPPYQKPIAYHKALFKLLYVNNYSIIHSHISTLSVFPLFAAKRAGIPVRIAHSHNTAGKGELLKNILKYTLRPFSRIFPTHFCACSEYAGRWLFGNRVYDSGKAVIMKNAIELSKFGFEKEERKSIREELELSDKFVIGHVGRFMTQKNHSFLIDIFRQVRLQKSNAVLLLVGEGELERKIRDKVEQLGLSDCVRFMGVRNDVNRLMQSMDVFLLPSLYEGLGIVLIEAQTSGLRIIASDKVPMEAKVADNFMYMSLNQHANEWAEKTLELISETRKSETSKMADAGFDIADATVEMEKMYERLCNKESQYFEVVKGECI